jgi:L-iditol 2-dehydrogenase
VKYDPSIPFDVATFFEPSTIALRGVNNNDYKGGEYVAIIGGGTIGNFTMQWAKIFGGRNVVVFDIDESRLALAKKMGADAVVNSGKEGFQKEAMDITQGRGFGYVFEAVGANSTLLTAMELAAAKAHVCFIGTPSSSVTFTKGQWELINRKEMLIRGCWQGYSAPFPGREWELTAHYFKTGQLMVNRDFIFKKFPLSRAKEAFDLYRDPSQVHGKILLVNE